MIAAFLSACAMPGIIWKKTEYSGPLVSGKNSAEVLNKCDMAPAFMSDVVACNWAFVDSRGRKVDVTDDVQKVLDDFMPQVDRLRPWVKVATGYGSPDSPSHQVLPYRLHLVTISPVVLLVVPWQTGDTRASCSRWPKDGCIPSRRFDFEPYWYHRELKVAPGAFWVIPSLGVASNTIDDITGDVVLELPDSRIRLTPVQGVWSASREMRPQ